MKAELVIFRGLPASGKTTAAKAWVKKWPHERARVNRDDLREMLHGGYVPGGVAEGYVRGARDRLIRQLLGAGVSVASDDTNLPARTVRDLMALALGADATVRVRDLTGVDVELCVERDKDRRTRGERAVGESVIRDMHKRFLAGQKTPLPVPEIDVPAPARPYVAKPGLRKAIMVDLDGTLCLHNGRSPYDESRVGEDLPNPPVVDVVRRYAEDGYQIVFCSGRSEDCREATERWIGQHVPGVDRGNAEVLMRLSGDKRKDALVKREMFDHEIRDYYDIAFVLDDRQRVVDEWRALGLTVFQVAPGDF